MPAIAPPNSTARVRTRSTGRPMALAASGFSPTACSTRPMRLFNRAQAISANSAKDR